MSVTVVNDEFMVCTDCLMPIVNDDWSSLDYHYSGEEYDNRRAAIEAGIDNAGGHICFGDENRYDEFSSSSCDCCGCSLHGSRHHMVVLGNQTK